MNHSGFDVMLCDITCKTRGEAHLQVRRTLLEVHANVRAHAPQRVALVPADGAAKRLDARVCVHVTLRGASCGGHYVTAQALPPGTCVHLGSTHGLLALNAPPAKNKRHLVRKRSRDKRIK